MPEGPLASALPDAAIAVVGAACHLPGARNYRDFWSNLRDGVESVHFFTDEELRQAGVPEAVLQDANYVKASPILERIAGFDAAFWSISPKDAAIMDPQHRHFLECAHEALEDAGHDPARFDGSIGVFGGCGANSYLMFNLLSNPQLVESVGMFLLRHTNNDKDFLTTFTSYKLGLEGPSVGVQTACSTSLVAIHMAAQQLLNGECDMALAGGSTLEIPHHRGYRFEAGEILSPDGHCRPFDADSAGTVFGSGAGIVVLRRLADALADGDTIRAVLRGSAVNNDGARKVGYLAPSVEGQAHAIAEALAIAEVDADTISYVEAHGTGTPIGDPIEIAALTQAFRETTSAKGYCAIGSCKSNIGHIDTGAGVAAFLKVVESLRHRQLPPTLFFENPNPLLELESSPFRVQAALSAWPEANHPRRAGVNSLGVGGTNAHAILEEAPTQHSDPPSRGCQVLPLSARTRTALDVIGSELADRIEQEPDLLLADIAYTLQLGRAARQQRRTLVCHDREEAIALLRGGQDPLRKQGVVNDPGASRKLAFLLPGGGAQYPGMAKGLYLEDPNFRSRLDQGMAWLLANENLDLRPLFTGDGVDECTWRRPSLQLPAIFLVELAVAERLMSWGIQPDALLGHSLGENTAACLAGVFSFEDALGLVALRGRLFEDLPPGGMLSVELPAADLASRLDPELVIAVHNTPGQSVASGPPNALDSLELALKNEDIECRRIDIDCAAHSPMLEPILGTFRTYLESIALHAPRIPIISNLSGDFLSDSEATDPAYWVQHLRHPVHFAEGIGRLLADPTQVLLEVGPGKALASLARQHPLCAAGHTVLSSLRHRDETVEDLPYLCSVLGQLWNAGLTPDWHAFHGDDRRLRVPLPTYPFERQDFWIEAGLPNALKQAPASEAQLERLTDFEEWFSEETWQPLDFSISAEEALQPGQCWLLFLDRHGLGQALAERLRNAGQEVRTVREGDTFYRLGAEAYALSPETGRQDYEALVASLVDDQAMPQHIVHMWSVTGEHDARPGSSRFHHNEERGFFSLFFLAQALGELDLEEPIRLSAIANNLHAATPDDRIQAEKALLLGPVGVIPREYPFLKATSLDLDIRDDAGAQAIGSSDRLLTILLQNQPPPRQALRGDLLLVPQVHRCNPPAGDVEVPDLPQHAVVLITGGLGGLGQTIAKHLATKRKARLVLLGRSHFPKEADWDNWLVTHSDTDRNSQRILELRALQASGSEVLVLSADVANLEQMRDVRERILTRFGRLDGIIHAAGVLEDGLIQMRTPEAAERVFTPKVHGTMVLRELFREDKPACFLLCSSTSVALPPPGQVDYVAANAFLNAAAIQSQHDGGLPMIALNWGIWRDVGMAHELANRLHQTEEPDGERQRMNSPWFQERILVSATEQAWEGNLDVAHCWVLEEHRLQQGQALLPGTAYLDIALQAFQDWQGYGPTSFSDVQFLDPCEVQDQEKRQLRLHMRQVDSSNFHFEVSSRSLDSEQPWQLHAQGQMERDQSPLPESLKLSALLAEACRNIQDGNGEALPDPQDLHLRFGPRFRCHHFLGYGDDFAYAKLALPPEFRSDLTKYPLHPALLDVATGCAMGLLRGYDAAKAMFVPWRYGRLRALAPLTADLHCRLRVAPGQDAANDVVAFDVEMCAPSGEVLVVVEGLELRKLDHSSGLVGKVRPKANTAANATPGEQAFLLALSLGIEAEQGMAALDRVLGDPRPRVVTVSSMDLDVLERVQDASLAITEHAAELKFERPQLSSDYVAPQGPLEEKLVAWWEELLGVESVGVQDDFFEVGGHSLVAVRLFARIKQEWHLDYPLSLLFEAPTIRMCAERLREELGETTAEGDVAAPRKKAPTNPYLVQLNQIRGLARPPFFLVAGMFGNVLNLRHLATHLGDDQPMVAIQARGLHGEEAPHRRFEDMARDYLEEMRKLQPHGPYFLGGFSGGGITAFEMAQQLAAQGEQTAALILLDTPVTMTPSANLSERLSIQWQRLRRRGTGYLLEWPKKRIAWEFEKRRQRHQAEDRDLAPAEFRSEQIQEGFIEALKNYHLRPYQGPMTLFRPPLDRSFVLPGGRLANDYREIQDHANHWTPYAQGGIEVIEVPGDHDTMVLEPHVRVLGNKVRQVLHHAQASQGLTNL